MDGKPVPQVDLVERARKIIHAILEARKGDDDIVEWSLTLVPVYTETCEDCGSTEFEFVYGMVARVYCPEIETTMISHLMHPIAPDTEISQWINDWWDRVTVERMADAMEAEDQAGGQAEDRGVDQGVVDDSADGPEKLTT